MTEIKQIATAPNNLTVLIDIDDVLIDLLPAWVAWLNERYNKNVDYTKINQWDMMAFYPLLSRREVFAPLGDMLFWSTVKPKKDAEKYLKMTIKQGFHCYLCSATHYETIEPKYKLVINKYFPFISWDDIIITSHKEMVNGDILIDDGLHNLINFEGVQVIFDAPHNQIDYKSQHYDTYRVSSWKEIYELLNRLVGIEPDDN